MGELDGTRVPGAILVVEDDPILRRVVVKILQSWGHTIVEAVDGVAALEEVERAGGDLAAVLLDLMLPRLHGLEVARRLRDGHPELPIVACSAALTDQLIVDLVAAGVRAILPKPYTAQMLRATLARESRLVPTGQRD